MGIGINRGNLEPEEERQLEVVLSDGIPIDLKIINGLNIIATAVEDPQSLVFVQSMVSKVAAAGMLNENEAYLCIIEAMEWLGKINKVVKDSGVDGVQF